MKKETLREMILNQYNLNSNISGEGWVFGLAKTGKQINWARAIMLEGAELIDSYPWKHWKNIDDKADYANIKIELSDIWHFIMSYQIHIEFINTLSRKFNEIAEESENKSLKNAIKKSDYQELLFFIKDFNSDSPYCTISTKEFFEKEVLDKVVDFFSKSFTSKSIITDVYLEKFKTKKNNINVNVYVFEKMVKESAFASEHEIQDFGFSNLTKLFSQKHSSNIKITDFFFYAIKNIVIFDLEKLYFGKSILNQFRQDHGYKEGTYIKNWGLDKLEDNVIMISLIEKHSIERLYKELENSYKELNKKA